MNQLQRLQAHINYKNVCGENWVEAARYTLSGISGKNSLKSPELSPLFRSIERGGIDAVLCASLDRLSRDTSDFLLFEKYLSSHGVEFIDLKYNFDTSTPVGRMATTIMASLNQCERERIAERVKDAVLDRAHRGLWNGGTPHGYRFNPEHRGHLIIDDGEKAAVEFAFKEYLNCGSILTTARMMNEMGFKTREYLSKRGNFHPATDWTYDHVRALLKNHIYIGQRELYKKGNGDRKMITGEWEPLVDQSTFEKAQSIIKANSESKHNQTKKLKHNYLLNGGLLICKRCGSQMEGCSGTSSSGRTYYYYRCQNCKIKVCASDMESVIITRVKELAQRPEMIEEIIRLTNTKLQAELPQLRQMQCNLEKELQGINSRAETILNHWTGDNTEGDVFIRETLATLGKNRKEKQTAIMALKEKIENLESQLANEEMFLKALKRMTALFDCIQPQRQKELLNLALHKATYDGHELSLEWHGDDVRSDVNMEYHFHLPKNIIWDRLKVQLSHLSFNRKKLELAPSIGMSGGLA